MLLLGIDLGTSSIKVSVIDADTQRTIVSAAYPDQEAAIISPRSGWAEQDPNLWWEHTQKAILKAHSSGQYNPAEIGAIGISYQMHGLILVDQDQHVLRPGIIWCDSRAVAIGEEAFDVLGKDLVLYHHLNSPGNFTASKLAWVKKHEPEVYAKIDKILLPGDFLTMKLTGEINTTISALSEGIFWDFRANKISDIIMDYFGFSKARIPAINPVFHVHGKLKKEVADLLGLSSDVVVSYKAGDQPNNALSLNVLEHGEVAATAGTSGVIYTVSDQLIYDPESRINSFAHVNYTVEKPRTGTLLCINGTGIQNRWIRDLCGQGQSYDTLNNIGLQAPIGSQGLKMYPFGNGAERMLGNKLVKSHICGIDFNLHRQEDIIRASQEGIACAFRYGLDIMRQNGVHTSVIRAGHTNLFLSPLFTAAFVNITGTSVELYNNDGSVGAALGAGVGLKYYTNPREAAQNIEKLMTVEPLETDAYAQFYDEWKQKLNELLVKH